MKDLNLERNVLMKYIYPKLKVYCREKYGFDFYAIDMRWGVPNVTQLDHLGPKTCYDEVEHCKFLSIGPTFITVLGQRYGEYEIPFTINSYEMELLKDWSKKIQGVSPKCFEAFEEWYLCDKNDINQAYHLKPIVEAFQLGDNRFVEDAKQRWYDDRKAMHLGINKIIPVLTEQGLISSQEAIKYSLSVTEHEIILGILNADDSDKRKCAAFTRTIKEIDEVLQSKQANKFLDMNHNGTLDETRFEQINCLRNITLAAVLKENNIRNYEIPWSAIENDGLERTLYLRKFGMDFESKTISLIDKAVSEMSNFENDDLYVEVLQHLNHCNEFVQEFHGRSDVLEVVKRYIQGDSLDPFVIYGQSGSGKTSVMAKLAVTARDWINEISNSIKHTNSFNQFRIRSKHAKNNKTNLEEKESNSNLVPNNSVLSNPIDSVIVIIRFLGTSPGTSTLRQTLKYTCRQLVANINSIGSMSNSETFTFIDPEVIRAQDDFQSILNTFYDLLIQLSNMQRHVLIFFDAIDQLEPSDGAYFLGWIRVPLPRYVKLIISTLPDIGGILDNFRSNFLSHNPSSSLPIHLQNSNDLENNVPDSLPYPNFIEVEVLDDSMCEQLLKTRLASNGRCLQPFQWKLVKRALSHCHLTLFIVLVERVVSQWKSWHQPDYILKNTDDQINANTPCTEEEVELAVKQWPNLELALTVRGAIVQFFESLEHTHGKLLTSHAISYITASRRGLSEAEIVDLLSLDDEVLRDVFEHHLPPQVRAPPFVWTRLRNALGSNLAEREADGIVVLFWYHRQFIEAAQDCYLSDINHRRKIHSNIADYFLGKWAGVKKTFYYPKYLAAKLKLPPSSNEDRMVPPQPYVFEESQISGKKKLLLNLRKLNELPWHLCHSGRFEEFYSEIMFNYEFLYNKLRGTSRSQLLMDLQLPIEAYRILQIEQLLSSCTQLGRLSTNDIRAKLGGLNSALFTNHSSLLPASDTTTNANNLSAVYNTDMQSPAYLRPPPPEAFKVYNCIRIAALSLDYQPSSLPIDILGRLTKIYQPPSYLHRTRRRLSTFTSSGSRRSVSMLNSKRELIHRRRVAETEKPVNIYRDLLEKLLVQSRYLGCKQCALLPRTTCFDSGSGLLHTTFDIGLGIGRLMSNNLILAVALNGKSVSWYDLDGVSAIFSYENDLLFTTGRECFLLVWSTMTGHILKIIAQGCAEGILSGLSAPSLDTDLGMTTTTSIKGTTNSSMAGSVLVICHFPDTTTPQYSESPDQAMFIMCKIFNVKSLRKPDKQLAVLGSQLFYADDSQNTNLNIEEIATGGPLVYWSANMSIEYVYEDCLSTLVLVTQRKEERNNVDNLILYDLDEDSTNPIYSWSDNEVNAKSIDTFLTTQQLVDWATTTTDIKSMGTGDKCLSYTHDISVFLHKTATKINTLTIFNQNQLLDSYTYLDPIHMKDYLPNLYVPTSNGFISSFGLIQSKYGMLTLIKPSFDDEAPSLLVKVLISSVDMHNNMYEFKSLWGEQPREINLIQAYQLTKTAGKILLDKRDLQIISLNLLTYRPSYPYHIIIGLNESHKTLYPVTRCDGRTVVWLGVIVIVDLGYPHEDGCMDKNIDNYPQVLHTILLDYGPNLILFPDGMTAINYRLNMYNIVTGNRKYGSETNEIDKFLQKMNSGHFNLSTESVNDNDETINFLNTEQAFGDLVTDKQLGNIIVSKSSNEENIFIQSIVLASDGKLLIGKRHHPEQRIHLDLAGESSSESYDSDDSETDYGASPARCLVAYEISTAQTEVSSPLSSLPKGVISDIQLNPVTEYMFENEPYMLWLSRDTKTLIAVTPNEYLRGFDLGLHQDGEYNLGLLESVNTEDQIYEQIDEEVDWIDGSLDKLTEDEKKMKMLDYFEESGLTEMMKKAMFDVVDKRPIDPISYIAKSLLKQHHSQDN
uniref:Leucine-rich repeat and WD repeat-containing protein n=1 Tax=Schistosoma haematobium TaxID=6185 RepID=A0A095AK72_SCHHA